MLHKLRIALAAILTAVALNVVSAVDSASASNFGLGGRPTYYNAGGFMYGCPCP
jgi:hypothetical protein